MSRWQPHARERLERAALELFVENGFADTTVPQITARAGLTTRTFFRHFVDKREVLFAAEEQLPSLVARLMAQAPASLGPLEIIEYGLEEVASTRLKGQRSYLVARRSVIQSDEGLRERELRKLSVLSESVAREFLNRGFGQLTSALTAHLAVDVFSVSLTRWLDEEDEQLLSDIIHDTVRALHLLVAGTFEQSSPDAGPPV